MPQNAVTAACTESLIIRCAAIARVCLPCQTVHLYLVRLCIFTLSDSAADVWHMCSSSGCNVDSCVFGRTCLGKFLHLWAAAVLVMLELTA